MKLQGWRARDACGEAWRNWVSGRAVTATVALLALLLIGAPAVIDALTVTRTVAAEREWLEAGGHMLVVTNENGGVSRERCEELNGTAEIASAASLTRLEGVAHTAASPHSTFSVSTAGPGIYQLLGLTPQRAGVLVAKEVAEEIGSGEWLMLRRDGQPSGTASSGQSRSGLDLTTLPPDPLPVAAVADLSVLGDAHTYAVLVPVATVGSADACFVKPHPASHQAVRAALPALLVQGADSASMIVSQRLTSGEFQRDFDAEFRERPSGRAAYASGAALGSIWILVRWARRAQDGLYVTLGCGILDRAIVRGGEWGLTIFAAALTVMVAAVAAMAALGSDMTVAVPFLVRSVAIASIIALAPVPLWAALSTRDPLAALKDR